MTGLQLSTNTRCVQCLLFFFNLIFVMTGIILLSIGVVAYGIFADYEPFLDNKFFSVPSLLIAVGLIIFFIAFLGCCGAARENYCMILTFTGLMVLIFILELSAGISGYVLRSRASEVVEQRMMSTMTDYRNGTEMKLVWDELQKELHCCGTKNATEWYQYLNNSLPRTCCPYDSIDPRAPCTLDATYKEGCYSTVLYYVKGHAVQLGGVGIGIACIQVIGIWFSIYLARSIRSSYETV